MPARVLLDADEKLGRLLREDGFELADALRPDRALEKLDCAQLLEGALVGNAELGQATLPYAPRTPSPVLSVFWCKGRSSRKHAREAQARCASRRARSAANKL